MCGVQMYKNMMAACAGIVRQQGVRGLFNGISPTIAEIIPYAGMQYGFYDVFKHALLVRHRRAVASTVLCSAHVAPGWRRCACYLCAPPCTVICELEREDPRLLPMCSLLFSFFCPEPFGPLFRCCVQDMKRYLARLESRRQGARLSRDPVYGDPQAALDPFSKFMCGLAAGSAAKAICHPLDVVKKRFQVREPTASGSWTCFTAQGLLLDGTELKVDFSGWLPQACHEKLFQGLWM